MWIRFISGCNYELFIRSSKSIIGLFYSIIQVFSEVLLTAIIMFPTFSAPYRSISLWYCRTSLLSTSHAPFD